jgi:LysR family transcriptional regulator, glycine cleavage system transcriptional activator
MADDLPPLVLLRAFDAAGRHFSFARAAESLHLTPSTISHQIADLERHLGASLFVRGPRGLTLTATGAELLADVAAAFERLRAAGARLRRRGQPSTIRISANPFFAAEVLIPLIEAFDRAFPGQSLHVQATEALEDPRDLGVDFCVRSGALDVPGLERHPLYAVEIAPVTGGRGRTAARACIDFPFKGESAWRRWEQLGGGRRPAGGPVRRFSSYHAAMRAAAEGLGTTLGMLPVVQPWLRSGRLRRVPRQPAVPLGTLDLVCRPFTPTERTLRRMRDWLIEAFKAAAAG